MHLIQSSTFLNNVNKSFDEFFSTLQYWKESVFSHQKWDELGIQF